MRLIVIAILFFFPSLSAVELSVEDCVARAALTNQAIISAGFNTERAIAEKNIMRSGLLPKVDLTGVIDNNNRSLDGYLTQFQDFKSNKALGLSAQVGLWDFGVTWRRLKATKLLINAAEYERAGVILEVSETVRVTCYTILADEQSLNILTETLGYLRAQLARYQRFYDQGLIKKTEVNEIQTQEIELQKKIMAIESDIAENRLHLNQLIGLPLTECITLREERRLMVDCQLETAITFATASRPDLMALRKQLEALSLKRRALAWSVAPQFYGFANGDLAPDHTAVSVGVGMRMPLYNGNRKSAELASIDAEIGELESLLIDTISATAIEVQNTCRRLADLQKTVQLDEQLIACAEQALSDAKSEFDQDLITYSDLLDAELEFDEARLQLSSTLYQQSITYAHFVKVTGGFS